MSRHDRHTRWARWSALLAAAALTVTGVVTPVTAQSTAPAGSIAPATLELWLGGTLTTATPGTPYETWVNHVIERFKAANPGSDVNVTLLPSNNDQLAAQVQAAFASGKVPDAMMLYSGAYTTAYAEGLRRLNDVIDATPGFYDQMNLWDGACIDFDCKGGSGEIVGVPVEAYLFALFYRKDILARAGITAPPTDFAELYAQCETLAAAGITPWVYGDRDGYTTSNMLTNNITSYFEPGDVQKLLAGDIKYTDPKFVDALTAVVAMKDRRLRGPGCLDTRADRCLERPGHRQGGLHGGLPPVPALLRDHQGSSWVLLGSPTPAPGRCRRRTPASVATTGSSRPRPPHPELAWEFIKLASDATAGAEMVSALGAPPVNRTAAAAITDPFVQYIAEQTQNYGMPILDSVMPNPVALTWYRELQQAFAGAKSPADALAAIQAGRRAGRSLVTRSEGSTRAGIRPRPVHDPRILMSIIRRRSRVGARNELLWGLLYMSPALAVVLVFIGYPFLSIVYHSFTRWKGYGQPQIHRHCGTSNSCSTTAVFWGALAQQPVLRPVRAVQLVVPLVLAFLIHDRIPGWRLYRWTYFLPAVYSTVVVGVLARTGPPARRAAERGARGHRGSAAWPTNGWARPATAIAGHPHRRCCGPTSATTS